LRTRCVSMKSSFTCTVVIVKGTPHRCRGARDRLQGGDKMDD
jgi:hypothetical protein